MARARWRRWPVVLLAMSVHIVCGYEETYTISQLSPKSATNEDQHPDVLLKTSHVENLEYNLNPSAKYDDIELKPNDILSDEEDQYENHYIVERSIEPNREVRSINNEEINTSNNNEIENEFDVKRKYNEIIPTKTFSYARDEEAMMMSSGFGDKLEFKFPGEVKRAPKGRALPAGPKIRPTAVQPTFATANYNEGRQNTEIQNIITGIVKLLNGNVNVQANTQLLNGRPRPMASRINNRGPPRISDLPPDFDKPISPPPHPFHPTKIPPPYPFDRPPGINLQDPIVPPLSNRPNFHRPLPPWQRRPRPPNRRPNPNLPVYKPTLIPPPEITDDKDEFTFNENESHSENNIPEHHDDKDVLTFITTETTTETRNVTEDVEKDNQITTTSEPTTITTTTNTATTNKASTKAKINTESTTTEKITEKPTEKPITTEKPKPTEAITQKTTTDSPKTEKPLKPDKDKKKDQFSVDKDRFKDKYKEDKPVEKSTEKPKNETELNLVDVTSNKPVLEPSVVETPTSSVVSIAAPTPTEGLISHAPPSSETSTIHVDIKTSSINTQPLQTSQDIPYQPYRPRPGIVLDDPEFKPHGARPRPVSDAPVITAAEPHLPGYGEIFDVTVSAIQGPGGKGGAVHIDNINLHQSEHDIIVSASGDQGFVSIDGKRTYLNLFDSPTASIAPTKVHTAHQTPSPQSTLGPSLGTGVAIPADDVPQPQPRPSAHPVPRPHAQRPHPYRRPQPTVRIDTCIVGDDSTCDQAQNEKCKTEAGISSCQCRPGYARRTHRDPCRRVVSFVMNLRVDRIYDKKVAWDTKLADKESDSYQQMSYEAVRAIDSAFSMTPFSDDFVSGSVNSIHRGDENHKGVYVNYTVLMQETPETLRSSVGADIQKHILGVIRRRSNNIGASALWVDSPAGSVMPPADLDECSSSDLNDCHVLAICTNTWGAFKCSCPDTTLDAAPVAARAGRDCRACAASHCSERGVCRYANGQPYCTCSSGYYGSTCEMDGEVIGVAVGASLAAALVIAATLAALLSWSRKWSREQKAAGMGSPVFNYMAANTIKTPPVGQPPYQVTLEERMRWAQIAEAMVQANHYAADHTATMATRPSSAMFGGYPTLPPVPLPRMGIHGGIHTGTLNTSRANTTASHHNLYGYTNHMASESTSSEASSHVQERADLLVPRPKSRARSMHNQNNIYYDVDYENAPEPIYGSKGIPLSTYTISRGPPFYRQ